MPNGCWEWQGHLDKRGYGTIKVNLKQTFVHRVIYFLFNPSIRKDFYVLHSCNNSKCVYLGHLRHGTAKENAQDATDGNRWHNSVKEKCKNGHRLTKKNTYTYIRKESGKPRRTCKTCRATLDAKYYRNRKNT